MTIPFKLTNMIAAEYIVEGVNNKHTIINVYAGDILLNEFPASIPIAFYMEMKSIRDYSGTLSIKLMLGKKVAMEGKASVDLRAGNPTVMAIPTGLVALAAPTMMRLFVGIEGERPVKVVEKKFRLNPAISPPSA